MFKYDFDINLLIHRFIPATLRRPKFIALLETLLFPIQETKNNFNEFAKDTLFKAGITGQVISLEYLLNTYFDSTLQRIFITNQKEKNTYLFKDIDVVSRYIYIYNDGEVPPPTATNYYLYNDGESTGNITTSFAINVPTSLSIYEDQILAYVKTYALFGFDYEVIYF